MVNVMRQLTKQQWAVLLSSLAYIIPFTIYYVAIRDYEFLWYIGVLLGFLLLILFTVSRTGFTPIILWALSLWGFLHMAGGGIPVGDSVLYGYTLIDIYSDGGEFSILKYDQVVHAFGFAVATIVAHHVMRPRWQHGESKKLLYVGAALAGMGLGSLNEIVEFIAVLAAPETGVGGYYNTALDLVFNTIGATLAACFLAWRNREYAVTAASIQKTEEVGAF